MPQPSTCTGCATCSPAHARRDEAVWAQMVANDRKEMRQPEWVRRAQEQRPGFTLPAWARRGGW